MTEKPKEEVNLVSYEEFKALQEQVKDIYNATKDIESFRHRINTEIPRVIKYNSNSIKKIKTILDEQEDSIDDISCQKVYGEEALEIVQQLKTRLNKYEKDLKSIKHVSICMEALKKKK